MAADSRTKEKRTRLPSAVVALGVTSFFADVGSEMIFPLLPVFVASLGASTVFLGLVEGMAEATASLLKLASGYIADHSRRKKPLVLFGYGLAAAVRPLVALATAPWHVLAVRITDRIGKGVRSSPRDVLIAASVSTTETGRAFGFHRAMDHAGAVIGPLIATALLSFGWSLRNVFWIAFIPGALSVISVATVLPSPRKRYGGNRPEPNSVRTGCEPQGPQRFGPLQPSCSQLCQHSHATSSEHSASGSNRRRRLTAIKPINIQREETRTQQSPNNQVKIHNLLILHTRRRFVSEIRGPRGV